MPVPIGAEDLYRFRWIDHVRLSRDGERVAYQLGWADPDSRQNRSRVVIRRLLDPEPPDPAAGTRRDHSPEWAPDGRRVAFISRVGAADQVFIVSVAGGGEPRQLSWVPEGVSAPAWSPDGSRIAFIGKVLSDPDAVVDDPRPAEGREQLRRAPVARVARRLDYKHDGQGYVDGRYHHLFVVQADGGGVTQLTNGAWDVIGFDWSPDGTKLIAAGNAEPGADLQRELNLYLVDLDGNRHRLGGGFNLSAPAWSPRGDLIAFIAPNGLDAGLIERLWVVPLAGGGPRCLTLGFDQSVADSVITDTRAGHGDRVRWSRDGDRIFFLASGPGVTSVYSADLEGNVRIESGGQRRIFDFDVALGVTAFCASDAANPGELHILTQGAEARLTDLNPWLRDRYIAQPEHHYFTAPDGWQIEGWLLKPADINQERLHPLVMEVHGGPQGQYGWAFFHELQCLAGMGYLVFYVNPRGSDGYGERFRREVVRDWGGKDFADLMSALDQIIERTGYVDSNRLGIGGGSYGGYMTNWAIGQTDRFSAAVAMRSISNLVSEFSQHDIVLWGALELGPPPWPDSDELWRRSPIRYVQNIRTPLLLTCGEMDLRCAISQSEELFGAMRLLGKTVELVRFPEESHDLSRNGRPDRRVERLRRIVGWYERFLGTAAVDREVEAATQILPTPVTVTRDLAATIVLEPVVARDVAEGAPVALEPQPAPEPGSAMEPGLEILPAAAPALVTAFIAAEPRSAESEPDPEPDLPPPGTEEEADSEPYLTPAAIATWGDLDEPPAVEPHAAEATVPVSAAEDEQVAAGLAETEMSEPEELPVLPEPPVPGEPAALEPEAVPLEPQAMALEPEAEALEPEAVALEPEAVALEPEADAVANEPEAVVPEPEPESEPAAIEAEPVALEGEPVPAGPEAVEPQPEAIDSEPEAEESEEEPAFQPSAVAPGVPTPPSAQYVPEIVVSEPPSFEPEPDLPPLEPIAFSAEPAPVQNEEPIAHAPEPATPQPVAQQPAASESVSSTMVRWPTATPSVVSDNGTPSSQAEAFEEATSIIPAWLPSEASDPRRTVSLAAVPPEAIASGAGIAAMLVFEGGPFAGRIVALPSDMVTVGRAPDNDIVVGDPATSGHHGRIEVRNGSFWLSDLGSTNGTLVNNEPVIEKQLSEGDLIHIGQNTIRFTQES